MGMKVGVISNVHGNLKALVAALSEIEKLKENGKNIERVIVIGVFGYMPYPKEVYKLLLNSNLLCVRGRIDHLIAKWSDMDEDSKKQFTAEEPFLAKIVEWNWEKMGRDARKWIRNDVPAFLFDKFGDNEFIFSYGKPFNIHSEVKPKMPLSYYESIMASIRKSEMLIVAGYEPFIAETTYGKVVCPGGAGLHKKGLKPSFAVIDTTNLDVSFHEFSYSKKDVEDRIRELMPPEFEELVSLLYHGI
ncbi:MAG: metallophosphatase family protein [Archaeoglobus sp.]|jgi:predicted phosphodiesterase|nr:MAG: metallophosphatase family protein [Archaeoglobus sp.]